MASKVGFSASGMSGLVFAFRHLISLRTSSASRNGKKINFVMVSRKNTSIKAARKLKPVRAKMLIKMPRLTSIEMAQYRFVKAGF